jgi:hypothetical protein
MKNIFHLQKFSTKLAGFSIRTQETASCAGRTLEKRRKKQPNGS